MHVRPRTLGARSGLAAVLLTAALLHSCGGDPVPPELGGSVSVTLTTNGDGLDPDGYTITVGSEQALVPVEGSSTLEGVPAGSYEATLSGVAPNCTVLNGVSRSVTVVDGEEAAVSFEVECVFDAAGAFLSEASCTALSPAARQGMPLDVIAIGAVPSDFVEPVMARMSWSGDRGVSPGLVENEAGAYTLMVPVHPSGELEGGEVTVRISDPTQTCPPFSFEILPLPTADGELAAMVDVAQELLDAQAELYGTTRQELLGTPASGLEPALIPLAIAQALVDDASNEHSLRAMVDGTSPDFGPAELDFAERLLARTGLRADLLAELSDIQSAGPSSPAGRGAPGAPELALSPGLALECIVALEMDAQLLHDCMTLARDKAQGAASEATQEKALFALDVAALLGSKKIAGAVASLVEFSELYDAALANNLPSSFVSLTASPNPAEFMEDQPGPGTWAPANAIATSIGWNLGDLVEEYILGKVPVPDIRLTSRLSKLEKQIAKRAKVPGYSDQVLLDNFLQGLLENLVESLLELGIDIDDELLAIPPIQYGPVDVSDEEWSDARMVTGTSVRLTTHQEYEPEEPGTSLLEVVTGVGRFGGTSIATEHLPITVERVGIRIEPAEVLLQPGQDTTFTVTVENALHPDSVELHPEHPAQGTASFTLGAASTHTLTYTAPATPTPNSTDLVAVRHTGQGGAIALAPEPRSASATIRFGGVRLLPVLECVSPEQTVQLQWEFTGFTTEPELEWSPSAGDVSASGLFTAPNEAGTVTITVSVRDKPNVRDSIEVPVGGCVCSFSVTVGAGATYVGQPGDIAEYLAFEVGAPGSAWALGYVNFRTPAGGSALFAVDIEQSSVTGPGPYAVPEIAGDIGYGGIGYGTYGEDGATLLIYEYEPHTRVTGEVVNGVVRDVEDPDDSSLWISATFQIYPGAGPFYNLYSCVVGQEGG